TRPAWCAAYAARIRPAPTKDTSWISGRSFPAAARPESRRVSGRSREIALHADLLLELVDVRAQLVLPLAGEQTGPDLVLCLIERDGSLGPFVRHLDDVEASTRLDHIADLAGLQRKRHPLDC